MPYDPYTDELLPWDVLGDQGTLNLTKPYTGYEYPPTFSNVKDAIGKLNVVSNRVSAMLPEYYQKVSAPLKTNTLGGLVYDIMPWTHPEMHNKWGAGPGSLFIEAHGEKRGGITSGTMSDPGQRDRQIFSDINNELGAHESYIEDSRKLGTKDKKRLLGIVQSIKDMMPSTEWGVVPIKDLVRSLGSRTNEIRQLINGACYAAGVDPKEWKQMFPALTNVVQSATSQPTTFGATANAFEEPASYMPPYTNAPGTSPLYNYALDAQGTPIRTNIVARPSDWSPTK